MSWHLFEKVLDEVGKQATVVGKLWITLLFMLRIISLTRNAETLYADEQGAFKCNTKEPGCENMCFNEFSPISHVRFWGFQTLLTATPSIIFIVFAAHTVTRLRKSNVKKKRRQQRQRLQSFSGVRTPNPLPLSPHYQHEQNFKSVLTTETDNLYPVVDPQCIGTLNPVLASVQCPIYNIRSSDKSCNPCNYFSEIKLYDCKIARKKTIRSSTLEKYSNSPSRRCNMANVNALVETERILSSAYKAQCFFRILLEVTFLMVQCFAFGYAVPESYKCNAYPCPGTIDCFISRPGEKSSMLIYMFAVTVICILLSAYELFILVKKSLCEGSNSSCLRNAFVRKKSRLASGSSHRASARRKEWFFVKGFMDHSEGSSTTSKSESDSTDASIDTGELDEMYEQEAELEAGGCEDMNEQEEF